MDSLFCAVARPRLWRFELPSMLGWLLYLGRRGRLSLAQPTEVIYDRDVRPILSENCFQCHGFDEKAGRPTLRLDVADSAYADRERRTRRSCPATPKRANSGGASHDDEAEMMPPPDSHRALSDEQKEIAEALDRTRGQVLRQALVVHSAGESRRCRRSSNKAWPRNEIDHFVLARSTPKD